MEVPKNRAASDVPRFNVVRYDMKWFAKEHNPWDYAVMRDMSVSQPIIVDKYEGKDLPDPMSEKLAQMVSNKLNDEERGRESVSIEMKTGERYEGPRYVYSYYAGE